MFPGVVFAVIATRTTRYNFLQPEIIIGLFVYYFIGLVLSRIGSLIIEPLIRKMKFAVFAPYKEFVLACKHDPKVDVLSEANNTYRTLCAVFLCELLLKLYEMLGSVYPPIDQHAVLVLSALLLVLFLFSYRKQSGYVTKRIKTNIE